MSRASPKRTRRRSASGTARPRRSRGAFCCRSATPSRCRSRSASGCCRALPSGRDFLEVTRRQPLDVVDELFENEHVKLLFLFKVSLFGTWLTDTMSKTSPMGSVIRAFDLESGYQLCQGGSFNLARGLMETFIASRRHVPAAGRYRAHRHRGRPRHRHRAARRPHGARQTVRRQRHRRASDLRGPDRPRADARSLCSSGSTNSNTPAGRCSACTSRLHESPRFAAEKFDPNINRTLKWSIGAETMQDLFVAPSKTSKPAACRASCSSAPAR